MQTIFSWGSKTQTPLPSRSQGDQSWPYINCSWIGTEKYAKGDVLTSQDRRTWASELKGIVINCSQWVCVLIKVTKDSKFTK